MRETDVMTRWKEAEPILVEKMLNVINSDPQVLLEVDGGPVGQTADVVLAVLYGFDEQVDAYWRLTGPVPIELRRPLFQRPTLVQAEDVRPTLRTADYRLQSAYARMNLDVMYAPPDVKVGPPDFLCSVLLVRYRRRG